MTAVVLCMPSHPVHYLASIPQQKMAHISPPLHENDVQIKNIQTTKLYNFGFCIWSLL